jgi:glycerol transport system ATP-binding protein
MPTARYPSLRNPRLARIDLLDVAHSYAPRKKDAWALQPMTLTWADSGAYALLGPSGCGKTTLLNIISGLLRASRGRVLFDQRDVTELPSEARNIAQVFQFPVIYDTMTVSDNLAFPLRNRGWKAAEIRRRVQEIAELLELGPDLPRRARGLTADARQRISLGRGLVRPDVAAVLFDEPLTVIDPQVKWLLRRKLKQIHQQLGITLIYVTHDQTEALTFADQVAVMMNGAMLQIGTPQELFDRPAHRFVGHFIGSPGMNFIPCSWQEGARLEGVAIETSSTAAPTDTGTLAIGIRPESIQLAPGPGPNRVPARLSEIRDEGVQLMMKLEVASTTVWARLRDVRTKQEPGATFAYLPPSQCGLYCNDRRLA